MKEPITTIDPLTEAEGLRFMRLNTIIMKGARTFMEVGHQTQIQIPSWLKS